MRGRLGEDHRGERITLGVADYDRRGGVVKVIG
jgi:hypothetical protein